MDSELMEKILDKIQSENPKAIVFCYGNSEPFLHPRLPECIASIKRRGLGAQMSTNLNSIRRVDELLAARPDMIIISLSGFTQEIYERGHAGGKIERVKENMKVLGTFNQFHKVDIQVNYHIYNDNQHEVELMREFSKECQIGFFTSYARAISMENAIQYNRSLDPDATPFELRPVDKGRILRFEDYNAMLPPISQTYVDAMKRLVIPPDQSKEMYKDLPAPPECPIGTMFCFIRHDGLVEMCACVADRRLVLGNYLDLTQDQMTEKRLGHPVCGQCSKYKLRYYFHLTGAKQWTPQI
jgi:MoaA/NifB/PqqE/SkfB family radical SAM enzyme